MTITTEEAEALALQLERRLLSGSIPDQLEAATVIRALAAERDQLRDRAERAEAEAERLRKSLTSDDVEWVVNDLAELGVKIGNQFFFCYKGCSLVYGELDPDPTKPPVHEEGDPSVGYRDGDRMRWRYVGKREFGECIHPINYADPTKIGRVSLADGNDWNELPAARAALEGGKAKPDKLRDAVTAAIIAYEHDIAQGVEPSEDRRRVIAVLRAALEGGDNAG